MAQAAPQGGIAVQRTEIAEQLAGAGEQHGVSLDHRLMGDVLRDRRLADAVGADKHDVGGVLEELQRHQRIDGGAVAAFGPRPVEVAERFEAADMGGAQPAFQTAAGAFLLLPTEQRRDPGFAGDLAPVREQPVQIERRGAGALCVGFSHRIGSLSWS